MKSNINNSKQSLKLNNHNRQRVRKTQGDSQTNYLWQQGLLDAEITDGQISRRYLYLGLRPIAVIDYDQNNKASIYSIHTDYLGTPKQITDQAKQVVWTAEYDDFGQITSKQAKDNFEFNLRFAGQYEDSESGYYYNWHRYYNPETGRYLTSDPIGLAGGLNTYVYANQSPSMGVDPWGLEVVSQDFIVQVMINDNDFYIGTHAGLILQSPESQIIWDPSGSFHYDGYDEGSARFFEATEPNIARDMWRKYMAYQMADGPNVNWYTFKVIENDYEKIYERVVEQGCGSGSSTRCAWCVSWALAGIGPFEGLESGIRLPSELGNKIEQIFYEYRKKLNE